MSFILTIDVGNSRVKAGLFHVDRSGDSPGDLPTCLLSRAANLPEPIDWHEFLDCEIPSPEVNIKSVIAGANPQGIAAVLAPWPEDVLSRPIHIEVPDGFPLRVDVAEPRRVGIDRLLNAVAVNVVREVQMPAIVIDSGTATTVDFITKDGAFAGGAILPGFDLAARSLHDYTALLPLLSVDDLLQEQHDIIGSDTRAAIRSGLVWGHLGAVRELVDRIFDACGESKLQLFLTGGGAPLLVPRMPQADWQPHLSLQGLALVAREVLE